MQNNLMKLTLTLLIVAIIVVGVAASASLYKKNEIIIYTTTHNLIA